MTNPVLSSRTGRCKNFWSCISLSASRRVRSAEAHSGLGVITEDTAVKSALLPFATTRDSRSLGVSIPTNSLSALITKTPLRTSAIRIAASRTFALGRTHGRASSPIMVFSVGTDPPNMLSTRACIASICLLLVLLPLPPAAFMAIIIASLAADAFSLLVSVAPSDLLTFSRTDIASYRHFAMSSNPTTAPVLSSTGKWRKRLSTIISRASKAESSS